MASIFKRKNDDGTTVWRVVIRIKGYPTICNHFDRKQEADDWAADTERQIRLGQFKFDQHNKIHTFAELIDRFLQDGALEHHRSAEDTQRHLTYWKQRLGDFGLVHITPEKLGKERQALADTPTTDGRKRSNATVNRYMSSLSTLLSYATQNLNWISENPALRLKKLKGRARPGPRLDGRGNLAPPHRFERKQIALSVLHRPSVFDDGRTSRRNAESGMETYRLRKQAGVHQRDQKWPSAQHRPLRSGHPGTASPA